MGQALGGGAQPDTTGLLFEHFCLYDSTSGVDGHPHENQSNHILPLQGGWIKRSDFTKARGVLNAKDGAASIIGQHDWCVGTPSCRRAEEQYDRRNRDTRWSRQVTNPSHDGPPAGGR